MPKPMPRALFALSLSLLTLAPAFAAAPAPADPANASPSDAEASKQALQLAQQRLKLTPEQTGKVRPLLDAHVKRIRALFEEYTGSGAMVLPSFIQEFQQTRQRFRDSLQPILTEPQEAELETLRKEVDDSLRELICDQRIASLKGTLSLTPEQETALRPIFKDDFEKKRALLAATTGPTGGAAASPRVLDDQVKKVQAETETRLAGVLSPGQLQTYRKRLEAKREANTPASGRP